MNGSLKGFRTHFCAFLSKSGYFGGEDLFFFLVFTNFHMEFVLFGPFFVEIGKGAHFSVEGAHFSFSGYSPPP